MRCACRRVAGSEKEKANCASLVAQREPRVEPDPATRRRHDIDNTQNGKWIMTNGEETEGNSPRRHVPPASPHREVGLKHSDRAGVLAPLMKSLGWELVGIGAEFTITDSPETRKPSGRMRSLFGTQVSAEGRIVGSSPTASAARS